ncbi:ankyrin repeat domain-containing protein [Pseudarthrobacter sp. J75]|uniref:ankyrin repeat domain-containing protein n=1 Tax=unclassified Pseudarthrobacter TaxID=2647000 RepID=UPI002E7FF05B|nr:MULTISPECIES: ankyrin repeat domain-containing protein [unclassified Pseudarthrobacter]MEE2522181.1 ankyrin repeat domain-containing protein [Pseudarthrobacter sp. J47]MEE2528173.1 ankyrin repeat domain-containing protein [Pseudarthrobacter sp. J75]
MLLPLTLAGCTQGPAQPEPTGPAQSATTAAPSVTPSAKPSAQGSGAPSAAPSPSSSVPSNEPTPYAQGQEQLDARLRAAAWANDVPAAGQLIKWGANVNAKDETVQSAYLVATSEGHLDFLRLTLAHGADVRDLDSWVGTGLIRAAERGHWDVVGELIQAGVPLDHVNRVGYQAIHEAVWFGRDDPTYHATVRVLIAGGVQFNAPSVNEGLTPSQMAARKGFTGQSSVLAALTQTPLPGDPASALLAGAASGDANAVALALRAGAPPATEDADGKPALQLAEEAGNIEAAQVLRALCNPCR